VVSLRKHPTAMMLSSVLLIAFGLLALGHAQQNCSSVPLASIITKPFIDLDDAYTRMKCTNDYLIAHNDEVAVFLTLYVETTFQVRKAIRETDLFVHKAWMEKYTTRFAELYRQALYNWHFGDKNAVPKAWAISFQHAQQRDILIGQHLVLGINAHINRDLAHALFDVVVSEAKHNDSTNINVPILIVYKELAQPIFKLYDPVINMTKVAGIMQKLINDKVATWREDAFQNSLRFTDYAKKNETWSFEILADYLEYTSASLAEGFVYAPDIAYPIYEELRKQEGSNPLKTYVDLVPWFHH